MAGTGNHDAPTIDVGYVARLARLYITEAETREFQGQLDQIIGYVKKIGELDLSGIEPTSHAQTVQNVFREDVTREWSDNAPFMRNAPATVQGNQFQVPKIVE